jgi:myosin heavy subunit
MEVNDIAECSDVPGTLIERHSKQFHYTFMGSKCLIAVGHDNTSKDSASKTWAQSAKEFNVSQTPHIFSMSSNAYLQMLKLEKDQSIVLL